MNEWAVRAYRRAIHGAAAEIARIHEHVTEDMMGIDPESVNHAHVADAMRLYANLEAISKWMICPTDYEDSDFAPDGAFAPDFELARSVR